MAAATEMLDENFGTLQEQDSADTNSYTLGKIGVHYVVIACLPHGRYGISSAATVANNMVRTFSMSLRVGLVVGVGGGIPSATHDIRLGDIVVSYPEDTCGGVLQYDIGKLEAVEREEIRPERGENDPLPHYGIIASGDADIKRGSTREQLRQETRALCVETQAAGVMRAFPCLVICGICDYADEHKNTHWQGYAALAAAAYAKELLGYMPRGQVSGHNSAQEVCKMVSELESMQEQQQRCHQAFKTSAYEQFKNINPDRVEGTCQWVLKDERYLRWLGSKCNDLLLISADPGCGKSVLARSLIEDDFKRSESTVSVCYFFFKDNDKQNNLSSALCAVLHQLFEQQPELLRHALPYWKKNGTRIQQEVDQLWRILLEATSDPACSGAIICVFDALDECHNADQSRLIQKLKDFYHSAASSPQELQLKFLVTTRPYDRILESFRSVTIAFPDIHLRGEMENDQIHHEINLVIKLRVEELATTLSLRHDVAQSIEKRLLGMEHRTYLWLCSAMDDICATFRNSLRPDKVPIRLIPASVNTAYEMILSRVPDGQEQTARKILQIIVAARRPLTLEEMAMALGIAISSDSQAANEARLDLQGLDKKIRHLCGLFVYIADKKVYLIHQTAREFLLYNQPTASSPYHFSLDDAESQMAEICVRYLLMDDIEDSRSQQEPNAHSFLRYAAENWADHVRNASTLSGSTLVDLLYKLYDTTASRFQLWYPLFWHANMPHGKLKESPKMSAIHLAALNGHSNILERLVTESTSGIGGPDDTGTTALIYASANGHDDTVSLLLSKGADVEYLGPNTALYWSPIHAACIRGHEKVIHLLLQKISHINGVNPFRGDPLPGAVKRGRAKIAEILLGNAGCSHGSQVAYIEEGGDIVRMLAESGAGLSGENYINVLLIAAMTGLHDVVEMLLEKEADMDYMDTAYPGGYREIVQLLLSREIP
ncbi:hypothetical protein DTO280E4_6141 [Paecilomyces variotii]|nr:hypothetical protein DTO195F2_2182 [Paecilomyces variotii]KAJ9356315.1 hypothetical protein DTO280E4_6141 [Paecilomyces variotii]KAJ9375296.1 hypothetical protein DTO282E5_280 [Paecilomyces variotii]